MHLLLTMDVYVSFHIVHFNVFNNVKKNSGLLSSWQPHLHTHNLIDFSKIIKRQIYSMCIIMHKFHLNIQTRDKLIHTFYNVTCDIAVVQKANAGNSWKRPRDITWSDVVVVFPAYLLKYVQTLTDMSKV